MIITFVANGSDLTGIRGWDALQSIGKKLPPAMSSFRTSTRTQKVLTTTLWLVDLADAEKISVTHKVGHSRKAHFLWYQKEECTMELTKFQSSCYLLIPMNLWKIRRLMTYAKYEVVIAAHQKKRNWWKRSRVILAAHKVKHCL